MGTRRSKKSPERSGRDRDGDLPSAQPGGNNTAPDSVDHWQATPKLPTHYEPRGHGVPPCIRVFVSGHIFPQFHRFLAPSSIMVLDPNLIIVIRKLLVIWDM